MKSVFVAVEREIAAPADVVYSIVADYMRHHPRILPPAISGLVVEEGGIYEAFIAGTQPVRPQSAQ